MSDLPDRVVLRPGRWTLAAYSGFCVLLAGGMAWLMLTTPGFTLPWALGFISVPLLCGILVPIFGRSTLTITRSGFSYGTMITRKRFEWEEVSSFSHKRINLMDSIWFGPAGTPDEILENPFDAMRGARPGLRRLMKHYGEGWSELLDLLNVYRMEALNKRRASE